VLHGDAADLAQNPRVVESYLGRKAPAPETSRATGT